ncbi:MAG: hypothetical protein AAGE52_18170 [Myxococcota bacterium]
MNRFVLGLAMLAVVGCDSSKPPSDDGGMDAAAAPDSGAVDSGSDAAMADAGTDSGFDAALPDAGVDAGPQLPFRSDCVEDTDCESNLCLLPVDGDPFCSRVCDLDTPHDCRDEGALCLPAGAAAVCAGPEIETGSDSDDANLSLGDCVSRSLLPLGADADLFQVRAATDDPVTVFVEPGTGVDVELEFYDGAGNLIARRNEGGVAMTEGLRFEAWTTTSIVYVLVSDAGSSITNPYRVCVEAS